jgi:hypothetical protein
VFCFVDLLFVPFVLGKVQFKLSLSDSAHQSFAPETQSKLANATISFQRFFVTLVDSYAKKQSKQSPGTLIAMRVSLSVLPYFDRRRRCFPSVESSDIYIEIFDVACQLLVILLTDLPLIELSEPSTLSSTDVDSIEWLESVVRCCELGQPLLSCLSCR